MTETPAGASPVERPCWAAGAEARNYMHALRQRGVRQRWRCHERVLGYPSGLR